LTRTPTSFGDEASGGIPRRLLCAHPRAVAPCAGETPERFVARQGKMDAEDVAAGGGVVEDGAGGAAAAAAAGAADDGSFDADALFSQRNLNTDMVSPLLDEV
jgi:hypothetical protein